MEKVIRKMYVYFYLNNLTRIICSLITLQRKYKMITRIYKQNIKYKYLFLSK